MATPSTGTGPILGAGASTAAAAEALASHLEVAVQVSRFHAETLEGVVGADLDIRGLTVGVASTGKELLHDAHLALRAGIRYGLCGRNGCGKTSLFKALASKSVPHGIPKDMRILYVQQDNVPGDERSVLQTVLDCGSQRGTMESRIAELESAMDKEADEPEALIALVQSIVVGRAQETAVEAEKIRNSRSRARGKVAQRALQAATQQVAEEQQRQMSLEEATSRAPELLSEMYEQLEALGGSAEEDESQAVAILKGLGFSPEQQQMATKALSGGWRMRVALAAALLARPHLLLLDEPTNHLDIGSILWLQDHLATQCQGQTVLVVSHDRAFLNAVGEETILLRDGRLEYFAGPYNAYVEAKALANLSKERQVVQQEKQRVALLDTIARAEKAARESGDDKRLGQAASRRKKIDRLGCERFDDGKRFKRSSWAGWHETQRPQVQLEKPEEPVVLQLPPPEALRQLGPILQLSDVGISYTSSTKSSAIGGTAGAAPGGAAGSSLEKGQAVGKAGAAAGAAGKSTGGAAKGGGKGGAKGVVPAQVPLPPPPPGFVLHGVTMSIEQGARIGLVGLNGAGKSSLLRVMSGQMPPTCGTIISPCPRLVIGCVDQHSGTQLVKDYGPTATAFSSVQSRAPQMRDQDIYDYLGKFAVPGPMAIQPLSGLSGGQRRRVALALTMLDRPHLLILDEPTNHLDLLTVQALSEALNVWEGTAVIASHDLSFLTDTCTEVWVVEGGRVTRQQQPEIEDAIQEYASRLLEALRKQKRKRTEKKQ